MTDNGESVREKIISTWESLGAFSRMMVSLGSALTLLGAAVATGWATHDAFGEQMHVTEEVDSLQQDFYEAEIPDRLRSLERQVDSVQARQARRAEQFDSLSAQIGRLEGVAVRILCTVRNNEPCVDPPPLSSGDDG